DHNCAYVDDGGKELVRRPLGEPCRHCAGLFHRDARIRCVVSPELANGRTCVCCKKNRKKCLAAPTVLRGVAQAILKFMKDTDIESDTSLETNTAELRTDASRKATRQMGRRMALMEAVCLAFRAACLEEEHVVFGAIENERAAIIAAETQSMRRLMALEFEYRLAQDANAPMDPLVARYWLEVIQPSYDRR
ncbi:hypothetical protein SLS62_007658, partial [Diatrype stigma]